ncbi:MAG: hypothetical protein Q8N58_02755 [bacterium]|nr:hypothetical protein [bacterium]
MQKFIQFLKKDTPNWLRNLLYFVLVLETVIVVFIYFRPELWINFISFIS